MAENVSSTNKRFRYFLYSQSQHKSRTEIEKGIGKTYVPGQILVNGRWKPYTEISITASNNRFADAKLVASGYLEDLTYKQSESVWRTN